VNRQIPVWGPITTEQQARTDADEARLARIRERANVVILNEGDTTTEGAVNCARCHYLLEFKAEKQAGWCGACRRMVSTWHPVLCQIFKEAA